MPRKPIKKKRESNSPRYLTEARLIFFNYGMDMIDGFVSGFENDEEAARACWQANRDRVMERNREGKNFGRRPWAFWKFEKGMEEPPEDQSAWLLKNGEAWPEELPILLRWKEDDRKMARENI